MSPTVPAVVALDEQDDVDVDLDRWQSLAVAAFIDQGITAGECNLLFVDEAHMTLPQVRGMHGGDRSRKEVLVEYGFRLPSALDNRPLNFG
ncbi:MAG: hypothetical protein CL403_03030, partial [Acidimicrobiaceae bacterium]|nr:hypothetical protein [Acidimicrobiaceae bacterium]